MFLEQWQVRRNGRSSHQVHRLAKLARQGGHAHRSFAIETLAVRSSFAGDYAIAGFHLFSEPCQFRQALKARFDRGIQKGEQAEPESARRPSSRCIACVSAVTS